MTETPTQETERLLNNYRGKASRALQEIERLLAGEDSLTQNLVRAFRKGHDPAKARAAYQAIVDLAAESLETYEAAIAQPEPKMPRRNRVEL